MWSIINVIVTNASWDGAGVTLQSYQVQAGHPLISLITLLAVISVELTNLGQSYVWIEMYNFSNKHIFNFFVGVFKSVDLCDIN